MFSRYYATRRSLIATCCNATQGSLGIDNLSSLLDEHPSSALVVSICSWMSDRSLPSFMYSE
jgi:hypothetical protein